MLELTLRLIVSLAVVVGLLLVLARFGARKFNGGSGALVHVVHRQPLSRTSSVAVVTVGSRVLVLGTTEHQVSMLAELDPEELDVEDLDVEELDVTPVPVPALALSSRPGGSHRAAARTAVAPASGALAGSVLSPATWRQAFTVATRGATRRAS